MSNYMSNTRPTTTRIMTNIKNSAEFWSMFPVKLKYIMRSEDTDKYPGTSHKSFNF